MVELNPKKEFGITALRELHRYLEEIATSCNHLEGVMKDNPEKSRSAECWREVHVWIGPVNSGQFEQILRYFVQSIE